MKMRTGLIVCLLSLAGVGACKKNLGSTPNSAEADAAAAHPSTSQPTEPNVMTVTVNGGNCIDKKYTNIDEICTSVTICVPGTQECQTIDGLLVDTGSSGLTIFASVMKIKLPTVPAGNGALAGCRSFSGGKSSWGPIVNADIVLGGEPAVNTSVFLMDSTYGHPAGPCDPTTADLDAAVADSGFNGILGVSHIVQDCGHNCMDNPKNNSYFSCTDASCVSTTTTAQLVNPVSLLPLDNNGIILQLPSVPAAGAPSISGTMTLGIGTRSNNQPGDVTVFDTRDFSTTLKDFSATPMQSGTIDSGSSKLYLPKLATIPLCEEASSSAPADQTGMLCPTQDITLTATLSSGSVHKDVTFTISNANQLSASGNSVSAGYASAVDASDPYFMWGLPFFIGRTIYVGIENTSSSLGQGPYWAF